MSQPERVRNFGIGSEPVYISRVGRPGDISRTIAIHCSDPWFLQATREFIVGHLKMPYHDLFAVPGGGAALLTTSDSHAHDRKRVEILLETHGVNQLVAIAHRGCALYKLIHEGLTEDELHAQQISDLLKLADEVGEWLGGEIAVELFFAELEGDSIQFHAVTS